MAETNRTVALIGGGTMGADIASTFAAHGWTAHIVNPRDRMRETLPQRLRAAMDKLGAEYSDAGFPLHDSIGSLPVRVNLDIPGFLGARLQAALSREAIKLVERGICSVEDIDNVVRYGFGFRYIAAGPLLQRDHAGLDVHNAGTETIYPDLCNDTVPSPYMSDRVNAGHIGMKAKKGFYDWTDDSIAAEKARYERVLAGAMEILNREEQ